MLFAYALAIKSNFHGSHINSIEKTHQGNYIVAGYHIGAVLEINGTTGSIIWQLGGKRNDFAMLDGYELKFMHHVRTRPLSQVKIPLNMRDGVSSETHLALSVFDNAFDTVGPPTAASSAGTILLLDLRARTAQVLERYTFSQPQHAAAFGSVQFLGNGDRFIGWGTLCHMTQHTRDARLVYHAEIADAASMMGSYRIFKAPWKSMPTTRPDIYAYSWTCAHRATLYASWNGATEVRTWAFYGADQPSGPFEEIALTRRDGFETRVRTRRFTHFTYAEARADDGSVLGRSKTVKTAVPPKILSRMCSEFRCPGVFEWPETTDACLQDRLREMGGDDNQAVLGRHSERDEGKFPTDLYIT